MKIWLPHKTGLTYLHGVPGDVVVEVADDPSALPSDPATVDFFVPTFLDQPQSQSIVPLMHNLKVLQLPSSGSDGWTDLPPASAIICDARGVHSSATAEWVVAVILAQLRDLPALSIAQRDRAWTPRWGRELRGKRVMVIGAGSVGSAVARRLAPFEVHLSMVARTARPSEGVHSPADITALLPTCDVVVLTVPLTDDTTALVDEAFLAALPDTALVVNASRGPVVDTVALAAELESGRLRAALDVTDPEPLPHRHPLWNHPHTIITPHVAALTDGLFDRVYSLVAEQVDRWLTGVALRNQVRR